MLASPVPAEAVVVDAPERARRRPGRARPAGVGAGSSACARRCPELGIVVCTGPSTVAQRVRGLRLGADDWITKPCHPEEVIARVQSVVRRRRRSAEPRPRPSRCWPARWRSAPTASRRSWASDSIDLTRREFELIELLAAAEGRVLEREEIYSRLWGYTMVRGDRSVDVFVRKLRQKLEKASPEWRYIHTHFGIGYRFAAESLEVVDPRTCPRSCPPTGQPRPRRRAAGRRRRSGRARAVAAGPRARRRAPSSRTTARPPFLRSTRPPVSCADDASRGRARGRPSSRRPSAGSAASARERLGARRSRRPAARCTRQRARAAARSSPRRPARRSGARAPWGCRGPPSKLAPQRARARSRRRAPAPRRARSDGARRPRGVPCGSASA